MSTEATVNRQQDGSQVKSQLKATVNRQVGGDSQQSSKKSTEGNSFSHEERHCSVRTLLTSGVIPHNMLATSRLNRQPYATRNSAALTSGDSESSFKCTGVSQR